MTTSFFNTLATTDTIRHLLLAQYLRRQNKQGRNFSKWTNEIAAHQLVLNKEVLWGQVQKDESLGWRKRYFARSEEDREAMAKIQLVVLFCAVALAFGSPTGEHVAVLQPNVYLYVTCLPAWHMAGRIAAVDKTMQHLWFYARVAQHVCSVIIPSALLHTLTSHTHTSR